MEIMKTTTALIIEPNCTASRVTLTDTKTIGSLIGGYFDCVRGEDFVGYVDDEGLMNQLAYNATASAIFGRYLVGRCVVVGSISPSGEYDGDSYDCPESAYALVNAFLGAMHLHADFNGVTPQELLATQQLLQNI